MELWLMFTHGDYVHLRVHFTFPQGVSSVRCEMDMKMYMLCMVVCLQVQVDFYCTICMSDLRNPVKWFSLKKKCILLCKFLDSSIKLTPFCSPFFLPLTKPNYISQTLRQQGYSLPL